MQIRTRARLAVVALSTTALFGFGHAPNVETVTGDTATAYNDPGGWLFNRDTNTATPFAFDSEEASIGLGSAHIFPIGTAPADKFVAEYFVLEDVSDVASISYDFLVGAAGNAVADADQFYANIYANFPGNDLNYGDCVYNVVPATSSGWTTMTFDPAASYFVRTRGSAPATCPGSPSDLPAGSTVRMLALNVGDTAAGDVGLDGYYDNVVVTTATATTVYDFEPAANTPSTKDDCKKGGWETFTDADHAPFKNQGSCVSWVNHNT